MKIGLVGLLLATSLLVIACEEPRAPVATPVPPPSPLLISQVDSTELGDILVSRRGGIPCRIVYVGSELRGHNREVNCRDGVPLFGNAEYLAKIFNKVVRKGDTEYARLLEVHLAIGRRLSDQN